MICKIVTHHIYGVTHYNSITTMLKQFIFNDYAIPL